MFLRYFALAYREINFFFPTGICIFRMTSWLMRILENFADGEDIAYFDRESP